MKHPVVSFVALILFMVPVRGPIAIAEDVVIITHPTSPDLVKKDDIKNIFLGRKTRWDDGTRIRFAVYKERSKNKMFLRKFVGKSPAQYRNYWKMQVFNGAGRMPAAFADKNDLIAYVSATSGAIGFISESPPAKSEMPAEVKIIEVAE